MLEKPPIAAVDDKELINFSGTEKFANDKCVRSGQYKISLPVISEEMFKKLLYTVSPLTWSFWKVLMSKRERSTFSQVYGRFFIEIFHVLPHCVQYTEV